MGENKKFERNHVLTGFLPFLEPNNLVTFTFNCYLSTLMKQFLLFCSLFWLANAQFSVAPEFKGNFRIFAGNDNTSLLLFSDLLPDELTDFLDKMSSEDEERFLDGKDADSELFDQLATVYKKVQEKLNKLNPDVRSFINNVCTVQLQ